MAPPPLGTLAQAPRAAKDSTSQNAMGFGNQRIDTSILWGKETSEVCTSLNSKTILWPSDDFCLHTIRLQSCPVSMTKDRFTLKVQLTQNNGQGFLTICC